MAPAAWPKGVARPAQRALAAAGVTQLADLTGFTEAELARLHGMGPTALAALKAALAAEDMSFKA
jgi:hypothetical protein